MKDLEKKYEHIAKVDENTYFRDYSVHDFLIKNGYANEVDVLSAEVWFTFDAKHLDTLAPIVKLKTAGASMSPFSTRNLPKAPYIIPKKDIIIDEEAIVKDKALSEETIEAFKNFINRVMELRVNNKIQKQFVEGIDKAGLTGQ